MGLAGSGQHRGAAGLNKQSPSGKQFRCSPLAQVVKQDIDLEASSAPRVGGTGQAGGQPRQSLGDVDHRSEGGSSLEVSPLRTHSLRQTPQVVQPCPSCQGQVADILCGG